MWEWEKLSVRRWNGIVEPSPWTLKYLQFLPMVHVVLDNMRWHFLLPARNGKVQRVWEWERLYVRWHFWTLLSLKVLALVQVVLDMRWHFLPTRFESIPPGTCNTKRYIQQFKHPQHSSLKSSGKVPKNTFLRLKLDCISVSVFTKDRKA